MTKFKKKTKQTKRKKNKDLKKKTNKKTPTIWYKKETHSHVDITIFNIFIKDQCKQSTVTIPQALNNQDRAQGLYWILLHI